MGRIQRQLVRAILGVIQRPRLTLAIAGVALVACATLAYFRLDISTDQNKLFSPKVKFFADYLEFDKKFPENEAVYVIVEPADPAVAPRAARWTALADAIADRMRGLKDVRSVDARVPSERLGDQGLLFEEPQRLGEAVGGAREFVPLVK